MVSRAAVLLMAWEELDLSLPFFVACWMDFTAHFIVHGFVFSSVKYFCSRMSTWSNQTDCCERSRVLLVAISLVSLLQTNAFPKLSWVIC